eukprot:gene29996-37141_t
MRYANGDVYTGEWAQNTKNGQGELVCVNGNYYRGKWKADMAMMRADWTGPKNNANGWKDLHCKLSAHWNNFIRVPYAESDDDSYDSDWEVECYFQNGQRNGFGEGDWYGSMYKGPWVDNCPHGEGIQRTHDEGSLEGYFEKGKFTSGTRKYFNGDAYTGGYDENNQYTGQATLKFANGDVYSGGFLKGMRYGK